MELLSRAGVAAPSAAVKNGNSVAVLRRSQAVIVSIAGSLAAAPASLALKYDDFVSGVGKAVTTDGEFVIDFDAAADFMSSNPMALVAGLAAVAVPLVAFRALASPQTFGAVAPQEAFAKLEAEGAQMLDVRALEEVRTEGTPDLKTLRKKPVQVAYSDAFLEKVLAKFKDPENTTLYILGGVEGNSLSVAKLLANNGFQGAYAIKGGVEAWQKNELPWMMPRKGLFDGLKDLLNGSDTSSLVPTTIGVAAAAGIGATVFTEAETVLQLLGSVAFLQIFAKKFLFAKDREQTIKDVASFLDTKVAPKALADDFKEVGRVLLPKSGEVKAAVAKGEKVLEKVDAGVA